MSFLLSYGAQYGLHAVTYLARCGPTSRTANEIAEAIGAPRKYMQIVLVELTRKGVLRSVRGKAGGYELARPANELDFSDVLSALSGPLAECLSATPHTCRPCPSLGLCEIRPAIQAAQAAIYATLREWKADLDGRRPDGKASEAHAP